MKEKKRKRNDRRRRRRRKIWKNKNMKHESKTEIMKNTDSDKTLNVISRRMIACTR